MRRSTPVFTTLAVLTLVAVVRQVRSQAPPPAHPRPEASQGQPCKKCDARPAVWSWKANGYALGSDPEQAHAIAEERAVHDACEASKTFLADKDVKCPPGCDSGAVEEACAPERKPQCRQGTHESDAGTWSFVCRKVHQHLKGEPPCGDEHKKTTPAWAMCDAPVKAIKTRACADPACK